MFLRIDDPAKARALMARMLPQISTAEAWTDGPPSTALHVALTYAGLQARRGPAGILDSFPEEFREGMAARAERLGDRGPSAPRHWEPGLGTGEAHVLVTVYAVDDEHLDARAEALQTVGAEGASTVINETRAEALEAGATTSASPTGSPSRPARLRRGRPRPATASPTATARGATWQWASSCSATTTRTAACPRRPRRRSTATARSWSTASCARTPRRSGASSPSRAPSTRAARRSSRRRSSAAGRDGTPLSVSPDAPDPSVAADPARINDFSYADDAEGLRCPLGAHIRRANPRDMEDFFDGRLTNRHRIIRRGRTYGPPLPPGAVEDDGQDRGLVFICFKASIWRQFETIQALWIDDGDPFGLGPDKDFLIGEPNGDGGKMTIQGHPPHFLKPQPRFVTLRGGEYLYRPSMTALRMLADGSV